MSEGSSCTTLKEWINQENPNFCRSCVLPLLADWYESECKDQGNESATDTLKVLRDKEDVTPIQIAEELDNIKTNIKKPELVERLKEFDCAVQSNEPTME